MDRHETLRGNPEIKRRLSYEDMQPLVTRWHQRNPGRVESPFGGYPETQAEGIIANRYLQRLKEKLITTPELQALKHAGDPFNEGLYLEPGQMYGTEQAQFEKGDSTWDIIYRHERPWDTWPILENIDIEITPTNPTMDDLSRLQVDIYTQSHHMSPEAIPSPKCVNWTGLLS